MSANHVHLINTLSIQGPDELSSLSQYNITSVHPVLISNDDVVYVSYTSTNPQEGDWIGAYSPPDVNVFTHSPVKWGYCGSHSTSTYLQTGEGQLAFNFTNLRSGVRFHYFVNGSDLPVVVANSTSVVEFENVNQPLRNRVIPTGDPNVLTFIWSSATSTQPTLKWGTAPGLYTHTVAATTSTIAKDSLCGGVAQSFGWRDLGLIHTANFTGLVAMNLSSTNISYIFGDAATNDFSSEVQLFIPPLAGTQPPHRPTTVALFADLGVGSSDNSYDTTVWREQCPPAINTTNSIADLVLRGEIDLVYHSGDISYANGYLSGWDFFLDMVSPISGRVPYLTTVGNHESDWPNSASIPGYGEASGGECSVCALTLLPMPAPATVNQPWWSYDVGIIHFVGMSTEHNFSVGSPQYLWLQNDLAMADNNRNVTPWIVFSGHRPMYVDSADCCPLGTTETCTAAGVACTPGYDVEVMQELRASVEPLLYQYRVNLAFAGHFHNVQRQSAVYQDQVVQAAVLGADADGNPLYIHEAPNATVWMLIGSAGNGPVYSSRNYTWSEKYWNDVFGYAVLTATNATHLNWRFINSADNKVLDRVLITQDFSAWAAVPVPAPAPAPAPTPSGGDSRSTGWDSMSRAAQGGVIAAIVIVGVALLAALLACFVTRSKAGANGNKSSGSGATAAATSPVTQGSASGATKSPLQSEMEFRNMV